MKLVPCLTCMPCVSCSLALTMADTRQEKAKVLAQAAVDIHSLLLSHLNTFVQFSN